MIITAVLLAAGVDWCAQIDRRVAHLAAYRQAQIAGLALVKPGATLDYDVTEEQSGAVMRFGEHWTVDAVAPATGAVSITVEKRSTTGFSYTEHREVQPQILGDKFAPDRAHPETCGEAYVFAHEYGRSRETIGGRAVQTLCRQQLNLGSADYQQTVSPDVPFALVSETLVTKTPGRNFSRKTQLIDFKP
jgi:hypothetical protein